MNKINTQAIACLALGLMFGSANATTAKFAEQKFDKVSLAVPAEWGTLKGRKVADVPLADPSDIPEGVAPEHYELTFSKHPGFVHIYSLRDAKKPSFKKKFPPFPEQIASLKNLLATEPAKPTSIPHLPWADDNTCISPKVAYLKSANHHIACIRSLAEFQQDEAEFTNDNLTYTAQGLSNDGAFYISVECPIRAPGLPDKPTSTKWTKDQWTKFGKDFKAYSVRTNKALEAADASSFSPSLPDLDHLVQSIEIAP